MGATDELLKPDAYPERPDRVEKIETHISRLYFADDLVYKVKKDVDLGFVDFSSLALRLRYCLAEVRLNRRLAPELYLGIAPVLRRQDGGLCFGEVWPVASDGDPEQLAAKVDGLEVVNYAVQMWRLPAHRMLSVLLEQGEVDNQRLGVLVDTLVAFHAGAAVGERVDTFGQPEAILENTTLNFTQTRPYISAGPPRDTRQLELVSRGMHAALEGRARAYLEDKRSLFEERVRKGRIRDGHGDLHTENICFSSQAPTIYDCIEFSDALRCGDVASDLAFLAMDLDARGYPAFSAYLSYAYAERSSDAQLSELLPFYKEYRAMVRAKVGAMSAESMQPEDPQRARKMTEARRYMNLAAGYQLGPQLVLTCGLPGVGKSSVAREVTRALRGTQLRSDIRRKELAGVPVREHRPAAWGEGLYSAELRSETYSSLLHDVDELLASGRSVVVDASFAQAAERARFLEVARGRGCRATVLWLEAQPEIVRSRLLERTQSGSDASDADIGISQAARDDFEEPHELPAQQLLRFDVGLLEPDMVTSALLDRALGGAAIIL